jgi:vacuolar-type H+-ATPase subunit I/STV1
MDASSHRNWIRSAILVGLVYLVAGIVFGALAGAAASSQMRTAWRLAAWLASAIAFAAHIRYDYVRLQNRPVVTASHAAAAVAFGAFALAVAANIHAMSVASANRRLLAIALVAWPVLAAIPAFLVALAATAVLARTRRSV